MQFRLRVYGPGRSQDFILPHGEFRIGSKPEGVNKLTIPVGALLETQAILYTDTETCTITVPKGQGSTHLSWRNEQPLPEDTAIPLVDGDRLALRTPAAPTQGLTILFEVVGHKTLTTSSLLALYPYLGEVPPGLKCQSLHLLRFLPGIYQPTAPLNFCDNCSESTRCEITIDSFLSRFLAIFESILLPVEWTIKGFDQFLDPRTAPNAFLPWLEQWFGLDEVWRQSWDERQRRALLAGYAWRGTRRGLQQLLEVYTGQRPNINDEVDGKPYEIEITLKLDSSTLEKRGIHETSLKHLIDAMIPAHTTYTLILDITRPAISNSEGA